MVRGKDQAVKRAINPCIAVRGGSKNAKWRSLHQERKRLQEGLMPRRGEMGRLFRTFPGKVTRKG